MTSNRFLIAPFDKGIVSSVRPWLLPENAFQELNNMYVFRGRIRKRFGSVLTSDEDSSQTPETEQLTSRLRFKIGTLSGSPDTLTVVANAGIDINVEIGQTFSVDNDIFTVYQVGAGVALYSTNGAITATIDTTASPNEITFTGYAGGEEVYFYYSKPVMGLTQYQIAGINDEPTYAFDTRFAYRFVNGGWDQLGDAEWNSTDSDFFWASTWRGASADQSILLVSNFVVADNVKYWDNATWNVLAPAYNVGAQVIRTAKIVVPFKDRLVYLNTIEETGAGDVQFGNRCRFSQNGNPVEADAFRQDIPGKGGFLDCSTKEEIVSAGFLRDRLIVFFERSTWELAWTGNQVIPFIWQQINSELGVESTFSIVPFDTVLLGIGDVGIHSCSGASVNRIDDQIPDYVFSIHNDNEGTKRVAGIRDYDSEMVYWSVPSDDFNDTFPTKVLAYNYKNKSWALFDDSITAFGYFQVDEDETWRNDLVTWEQDDSPWNTGFQQSKHRNVIAGNQQGFVFLVKEDTARNAPALQITDIDTSSSLLTVINHNLHVGDYIAIENCQGTTQSATIGRVQTVLSDLITMVDQVTVDITFTGTYTGGGTIARVSNPEIVSKQYNFFNEVGRNIEVTNTDFYVDKTVNGEVSINYMASSSDEVLGTVILETRPYSIEFAPLEQTQTQVWHRVYLDSEGSSFQIRMYLSDTQIRDTDIAWSILTINAIMFYVSPTGSRFE